VDDGDCAQGEYGDGDEVEGGCVRWTVEGHL
jgi:hypothetical protein